jgi:hypothetical protein
MDEQLFLRTIVDNIKAPSFPPIPDPSKYTSSSLLFVTLSICDGAKYHTVAVEQNK